MDTPSRSIGDWIRLGATVMFGRLANGKEFAGWKRRWEIPFRDKTPLSLRKPRAKRKQETWNESRGDRPVALSQSSQRTISFSRRACALAPGRQTSAALTASESDNRWRPIARYFFRRDGDDRRERYVLYRF